MNGKTNSCSLLRQRYLAVKGDRTVAEGVWDEIEKYIIPYRGEMFKDDTTETDVEWRKRWIYDSVPVESSATLSSSLHGSITSPFARWFTLEFRSDLLNKNHEAKEWLEECERRIWSAIQESNFDLEVNEMYIDLVGFGSAVFIGHIRGTYEDFKKLDYKAVPLKECYFEEGHDGRPKRFYRRVFMTAVQMCDKFGDDGVPEDVRSRKDNPETAHNKEEVVMAVYEREDVIDAIKNGAVDGSQPMPPDKRPYGEKWFRVNTAERLGEEGGFYDMPVMVIRWKKVSGSQWGHGQGHIAMGDILTLNQARGMNFSAWEKVIDPAIIAEDRGIIGDLDLSPSGLTIVRKIDGIRPFESASRFDVTSVNVEDLRNSIRRMFFVDQLQLKESPAMTAYEVSVRYELMNRLIGPVLGRIKTDFLNRSTQLNFNNMYRAGQLPEAPQIVKDANAEMDIVYLGPLARAQYSDQIMAITQYVAEVAQLIPVYPEVKDVVDPIKAAREVAQLRGVPTKIMRSDPEVAREQERRRKQEAMVAALATAQQAGDAAQSVAAGRDAMGVQEAA